MKKSMKIFMALALALFMTLGSFPVNMVRAEEPVTEVAEEAPKETDGTEQADYSEQPSEGTETVAEKEEGAEQPAETAEGETPAEQAEEGKQEEQPAEEAEQPADPAEEDNKQEEETPAVTGGGEETLPEEQEEVPAEEELALNAEAFSAEYKLGNLKVSVGYPADTVPEGTEVVVAEPKAEAVAALKEKYGEDVSFVAADISFVYEGKEIEPKNPVSVSLSYAGEENLSDKSFETVHIAETKDEEGNITAYTVENVEAEMTDVTETVTTPVTETKEITKTVQEPYDYTWTETVTKYKDVDVYEDAEVPYEAEEEVPVYEEREIVEEKTIYITKTRDVEKTKTVKVKVAFRLLDPSTWRGYKYTTQTYTVKETYKEPATVKTVIGTEEVQVGTETVKVTKYRTEKQYVRTDKVVDGTEEITHTETRYRDVVVGTGEYEEVPTGEYTEETIVVGQTTVFNAEEFSVYAVVANAFENNGEFVIYTGTTALAYSSGESLTAATVTVENGENGTVVRSDNDNILWTVSSNGRNYRLSTGSRYLQYQRSGGDTLRTTSRADNDGTNWQYDNNSHMLYATNGNRTRYLTYSNGSWGLTQNSSQAATVYIARAQAEPATGDLTYNYYNADHSESISAAETIAESGYTTTWTDVKELAKTINGYTYLEARANSVDGDIITQVNGRAYRHGTDTSGNGSTLNSIYFIYMKNYVAHEEVIPGLKGPETAKTVTHNPDGTFTIRLDVTGVTNPVKHGANVVVVLDTTSSMNGVMSSSDSTKRIDAAISAVNAMVSTLNPGDPSVEGQYDIDFALVEFNRTASAYDFGSNGITGHTYWTKSGDALKNRVKRYEDGANLPAPGGSTGGTNWQAALQEAAAVLEGKPDADPTYVIFMTDGEPSIYIGSDTITNSATVTLTSPEYARALPYATAIVNADYKVYDIFCSAGANVSIDGKNLLQHLKESSGAESYIGTSTTTEIENAFRAVANAMLEAIGSSNYAGNDGVPELGSFALQTVDGQAQLSNARYYKKESGGTEQVWTDAPVATPTSGGVKWDLTSVGTLENETVYSIEFEVWPSQDAYDLIADLNNGKVTMTDEELEAAAIAKTPNGDGTYSYTLKTNTTLSATYKLYGKTITDDDIDFTDEAMDLPTKTISVKKLWPENMLDDYGAAIYRDPETGEAKTATEIELTLKRENADYLKFTVSAVGPDGHASGTDPETGKDYSLDNWSMDDIYVSCGFMTVKDGAVDIKESGHDYQITEPSSFSYYWDLISDVYHPMVINGEAKVLVYDPDLTEADVENGIYKIDGKIYKEQADTSNTLTASNYRRSNLNLTKKISTGGSNPDDLFTYKVKVTDANSSDGYVWFSAWDPNVRDTVYDFDVTGGNVTKETKRIPENATIDTEAGTCTFINEDGDEETHPIVEGENKYYTGYFYATNGAELTMKIKAGWNVRFLNVYHGTTYSFEELVDQMPEHYEFVKAEASTQYEIIRESNKIWNDIDAENPSPIVTGTIKEPNNNYTITYTNKVDGFFYIYHSSDNTVERIPMNDARISEGKFNIVDETKKGYLYGGYYKEYALPGYEDDATVIAAEYAEKTGNTEYEYVSARTGGMWATDSTGTPYVGDQTSWDKANAYTESGKAMSPKVNTVYYLKEVPEAYLEPATYVVYDTRDVEDGYYKVVKLYQMTATDDGNYESVGYDVSTSKSINDSGTFASEFWGEKIEVKKAGEDYATLTASMLVTDHTGLIASRDIGSYIVANAYYRLHPFFVTPDNVKVTSVRRVMVYVRNTRFKTDWTKPGMTKVTSAVKAAYK